MSYGPPTHMCRNCGSLVAPHRRTKGNGILALLLLCLFIIPGVIYLIFGDGKELVCPVCKAADTVIPLGTPEVRRALAPQPAAALLPAQSRSAEGASPRFCSSCGGMLKSGANFCSDCGAGVRTTLDNPGTALPPG